MRTWFEALILFSALLLSAVTRAESVPPSPPEPMKLAVRPSVSLDTSSTASSERTELTIAEIVDPATISPDKREEVLRLLAAVTLTDRPQAGEDRTFSQEGLESIVAEATHRLEAAGYVVEWKIPRRCRVSIRPLFDNSRIEDALKKEFLRQCEDCDVAIRRLDVPALEQNKVSSWSLSQGPMRPRGSFAVPVELVLVGGAKKSLMLTGLAEFTQTVPVAAQALTAGQPLTSDNVRWEKRSVTYATDRAPKAELLLRSETARGIAAGEVLWQGSVRQAIAVRFGDPVRVMVGGDDWSVSVDGISQGQGAVGDAVRVKVGRSQKLVSGILKEKGLVEVH